MTQTSIKHSTNPITGSTTTTTTKKQTTHGHHHNGTGTTSGTGRHHAAGTTTGRHHATTGTAGTSTATRQHRKPSVGDKMSGAMMKLRGSLTGKPGLKVCSRVEFIARP